MVSEKQQSGWRALPAVFTGVGKANYSEVPINQEFDFNNYKWVNSLTRQEEINKIKELDPLLNNQKSRKKIVSHLLPVIPLINDNLNQNRQVSIVDFGGGLGEHYCMTYWYPEEARKLINYYVIEVPQNCIEGEKIGLLGNIKYIPNELDERGRCTYDETLFESKCDIVVICGVLQYFQAWRVLLEKLSTHRPKYFYITRTIITDAQTFYTCQSVDMSNEMGIKEHMGDSVHIIFNLQDLIIAMKSLKYELALDLMLMPYDLCLRESNVRYGKTAYHNIIFRREMENTI